LLNKENAMNVRLEGDWKFLNTPSLLKFERRAIGYDRLFRRIMDMPENDNQSYPPHNLIKESDTEFKIELALAGFTKEEVKVVQEEQRLILLLFLISFPFFPLYLHKGIASRAFTKTFDLAENIEVTEASFENGMVIIKLRQDIPEDKMPKLIEFK
jgi:molecular chaperone IbpA